MVRQGQQGLRHRTRVAFTIGSALGYVDVSGHDNLTGVALEPLSVGIEADPVCHLRFGLLAAYAATFVRDPQGVFRSAITVGYVMGACPRPR